ncbi:hypothetical protein D910_10894 [Dendroctonus ponderosae]|uniref:Rab3 GTPase-activating protein catalytic subunit n=1 Tax=Dendroctonus ponderosae TaxID=77166 RepID=U4UTT3_DENPD|nr:hypothetical protein D910_10894 [Dendroctonus ponderosae]
MIDTDRQLKAPIEHLWQSHLRSNPPFNTTFTPSPCQPNNPNTFTKKSKLAFPIEPLLVLDWTTFSTSRRSTSSIGSCCTTCDLSSRCKVVPPGLPDLRTGLLNQKLQMLNCCIERKIARANLSYVSAENSEDSDDEFFDATDQEEFEERRKGKYCPWDRPVGRLSPFANLKLIKTGDLLYIPFTQDPVLKTEDQLEEDTDILLKLGTNNEASQLRARIMSASLLSDMQSFKAANPGAVYSPRDWIQAEELDEYGQKQGALSQRMQLEGNIWMEMWQNSKPVPAHRQKRLFDDTKEAEKVLQFLELRTVGQIAELILPVLSHATISRLIVEAESLTEEFAKDLLPRTSSLARQCEKISRDIQFQPNKFEAFIQETIDLEMSISQFNSLQYKLNPHRLDDYLVNKCIGDLAVGRPIRIESMGQSIIGSRIALMLSDAQRLNCFSDVDPNFRRNGDLTFPDPVSREFVLRASCIRSSLYSAKCPQLLRAMISNGEFRLMGAFSEDITFI